MRATDHWTLLMTVVLSASFALGFVTQVTAYEKEERSRRTQVSAFGGLLLGSLASAQQNGDLTVAFVGLLGAGGGAAAGWMVMLGISGWAKTPERRAALMFLTGGPPGVGDYFEQLDLKRKLSSEVRERKFVAVRTWGGRYGQMIRDLRKALDEAGAVDGQTVEAILELWLRAMVDAFNYLMTDLPAVEPPDEKRAEGEDAADADADADAEYRVRASLIKFTPGDGTDEYTGRHWIAYAGTSPAHSEETEFRTDSTAWKVASRQLGSPCAPQEPLETRKDEKQRYDRYMVSLVLEKSVVVSVDWFRDTDYIEELRSVVDGYLAGQVADLLERHHPDFAQPGPGGVGAAADPDRGPGTPAGS
jgi:hypothetical protein